MKLVLDIEANGLENPSKIWVVVCKDIDTGDYYIFRRLVDDTAETGRLSELLQSAECLVGHNILEYDLVVLRDLLGLVINKNTTVIDTLILSRLIDYSKADGHSLERLGEGLGLEKIKFTDFSKYSKEMEEYCVRDVDICALLFNRFRRIIDDPSWQAAIRMEHDFQEVVNRLHRNGFHFNGNRCRNLLLKVETELGTLDDQILSSFPPKLKPIREIHPKITKFGTLSKSDFRWVSDGDLSEFNGGPFTRCSWVDFNPSSHKQLIEVLHDAGWQPTSKTKAHIDLEREIQRQRYSKEAKQLDIKDSSAKLLQLKKYGWKINEENLDTLPATAPTPARLLAKRILLESRRRTLTEWLGLLSPNNRIHGKFVGIGAWTHRMAHQNPNTANIPGEFELSGKKKLYGKEMRQLWCAPKGRLLVGVDAEGIQLRIFAHYIDDPEFTRSLVEGKKDDKTDPHSLNQRVLGSVCKSRAAAKRFIYALLLGAGIGKLSEILECSVSETREALNRLLLRYSGFATLKEELLPQDGRRGYFIGLDGRRVPIPGETVSSRTHLAMSGYLQNGEAIVMKRACLQWTKQLENIYGNSYNSIDLRTGRVPNHWGMVPPQIVNFVHDEWQTEVPNDFTVAMNVAKIQADSLRLVGEELGLKCPLAGSYWNDDHKDYTIGTNWYQTH